MPTPPPPPPSATSTIPSNPTAPLAAVASGEWNNPATWGGSVPTATNPVTIPAGVTVNLKGTATAATVDVRGTLAVTGDSSLTTRYVMVMGQGSAFEAGTPANPFVQNFTLELVGNDVAENVHGAGSKFLMSMDGGRIDLHGKPKVSWTKLQNPAAAGASQLTLAAAADWEVGDQVVIAPTTLAWQEAEVRAINAISADKKTLTLNQPLQYRHSAQQKTYTSPAGRSWTVDERAEVGLLSHNIKIRGDSGSESTGFGGHVMVMKCEGCATGGIGRFSNVEFYRLGQKKRIGRYPMHWHLLGSEGNGQYIKNSSVHHSFNRAIVLHNTDNVVVERNVAYDHIGHGIMLEDASERFNKIYNNLALGTKRPPPGEQLLPTDNSHSQLQNESPSTYWITNPNNEFIGNVAAGTIGTGFWFVFPRTVLGLSAKDPRNNGLQPFKEPLGEFRDNTAHSNMNAFDTNDGINAGTNELETNFGWDPPTPEYLENFTAYSNRAALYAGIGNDETLYRNAVLANNTFDIFLAAYQSVVDSLIVADTGSGNFSGSGTAYIAYDGPGRVRNSHFVGFQSPFSVFGNSGAAWKHANHLFSGVSFAPAGPAITLPDFSSAAIFTEPEVWGLAIRDVDGTLGGVPNSTIITNHPIMRTAGDTSHPAWTNAWVSRRKFGSLLISYGGLPATDIPEIAISREGGGEPAVTATSIQKIFPHHQVQPIVNGGFSYAIRYGALPGTRVINLTLSDVEPGDSALIRLNAIGKCGGMTVLGAQSFSSLAALKSAGASGYHADGNGDLWLRFVAVGPLNHIGVGWSNCTLATPPALHPLVFDPAYYRVTHSDLAAMNEAELQAHWLQYGIREGRRASEAFSVKFYLSSYPDLQAAYGATGYEQAINHYIQSGKAEGRIATAKLHPSVFNPSYYRANNADLANMSDADLQSHWLQYGIHEGRRASQEFSVRHYLARYPDLQAAYGATGYEKAVEHYVVYGKAEGRNGRP